jgi:hypothetical protein
MWILKKKYDYWWKKYGLEKIDRATKTSLFDRNWAISLKPRQRSHLLCPVWWVLNLHLQIHHIKMWFCSVPARNWKWRGATLEKGHFSMSKTMKKGNIVIFSYLILKMFFSTTFSALCIKFNASTWLIVYIYFITYMYRNAVKIWRSIKRHVLKWILVLWMFQIQF